MTYQRSVAPPLPFRRLQQKAVPEAVAEQIRTLLSTHHLRPGDRLPSERELAEALGVGRNALREGLKRLEAQGLVEIRQGVGTFLREPSLEPLRDAMADLIGRNRELLEELVQARRVFEGLLVELACGVASDEDLAGVEALLEQQGTPEALERTRDRPDMTFEKAVGRTLRNRPLQVMQDTLHQLWVEAFERVGGITRSPETRLAEHRAILAAIKARDATAARRAMEEHVSLERRVFHPFRVEWDRVDGGSAEAKEETP